MSEGRNLYWNRPSLHIFLIGSTDKGTAAWKGKVWKNQSYDLILALPWCQEDWVESQHTRQREGHKVLVSGNKIIWWQWVFPSKCQGSISQLVFYGAPTLQDAPWWKDVLLSSEQDRLEIHNSQEDLGSSPTSGTSWLHVCFLHFCFLDNNRGVVVRIQWKNTGRALITMPGT